MEAIETGYLLELTYMLESSIDIQFQAWMALSFAVIVASYSARLELPTGARVVVVIVYTTATYALFARFMTEYFRLDEMHLLLASRGFISEPVWFAPQARIATYFLGTLLTVSTIFYFGIKSDNQVEENT